MKCEHGWLLKDDTLSWTVGGVAIDPATRTRREEYHWVLNKMTHAFFVLDAAAGYVPGWHEMPKIIADNMLTDVIALDIDPRSLQMPPVFNVIRMLGDITALPFADKSFDTVVCISVLEHLSNEDAFKAAGELLRVCRNQLLLTADLGSWLPQLFMLPPGDPTPLSPALDPPVYWMEITL